MWNLYVIFFNDFREDERTEAEAEAQNSSAGNLSNGGTMKPITNGSAGNGTTISSGTTRKEGSPGTIKKRQSRLLTKLNMGDAKDDIHVCILCLRAIMNNKHGLSNVIQKQEAINAIALSLRHKSLRTKALVLELLAAICLVQGGHAIILKAFDHFKDVSFKYGWSDTVTVS